MPRQSGDDLATRDDQCRSLLNLPHRLHRLVSCLAYGSDYYAALFRYVYKNIMIWHTEEIDQQVLLNRAKRRFCGWLLEDELGDDSATVLATLQACKDPIPTHTSKLLGLPLGTSYADIVMMLTLDDDAEFAEIEFVPRRF